MLAGSLLASPALGKGKELLATGVMPPLRTVSCYDPPPQTLAAHEERVFRCGPPKKVQVCEPALIPQWNIVVDRCNIRYEWSNR